MSIPDPIPEFLAKLRARLRLDKDVAERIMAEVEDHLIETVNKMKLEGVPEEDAASLAIARFGDSEDLARAFDKEGWDARMRAFLQRLVFNLVACYGAANLYNQIQQLPWLLLAGMNIRSARIEFHGGLLTIVPQIHASTPLPQSIESLQRFWFLIAPVLFLLSVFLCLAAFHRVPPRVRPFFTYIVAYFSASQILAFLPFVGWGGGWFGDKACEILPSLCSSMLALRLMIGVGGGGLLVLANVAAFRGLLGDEIHNWQSQLAELSGWIGPIGLITIMVYTGFFQRWNVFAEASLTIIVVLIVLCGVPAVLLARYRRVAT